MPITDSLSPFTIPVSAWLEPEEDDMIIGSIILYYGNPALIPSGWHICDGTHGTVDLEDKFPMGADTYAYSRPTSNLYGDSGGSFTHGHNLTPNEPPIAIPTYTGSGEIPAFTDEADNVPPWEAVYYIQKIA